MEVKIYQIVEDLDEKRLVFSGLDAFKKAGYDELPAEIYKAVFSGQLDVESPEDLFVIFNTIYHKDFKGWSLSVSDVVEFQYSAEKSEFYFCDSFGFETVSFDKEKVFSTEKN